MSTLLFVASVEVDIAVGQSSSVSFMTSPRHLADVLYNRWMERDVIVPWRASKKESRGHNGSPMRSAADVSDKLANKLDSLRKQTATAARSVES